VAWRGVQQQIIVKITEIAQQVREINEAGTAQIRSDPPRGAECA